MDTGDGYIIPDKKKLATYNKIELCLATKQDWPRFAVFCCPNLFVLNFLGKKKKIYAIWMDIVSVNNKLDIAALMTIPTYNHIYPIIDISFFNCLFIDYVTLCFLFTLTILLFDT